MKMTKLVLIHVKTGNEKLKMMADETEAEAIEQLMNIYLDETEDTMEKHLGIDSDKGTPFTSKVTQMLAKHLSIDWAFHIPYHPQSSGMVERVNRTIKGRLRKAMQTQNITNWVKVLPVVLAKLRMARTDTLGGLSPYEIVMGRPFPLPWCQKTSMLQLILILCLVERAGGSPMDNVFWQYANWTAKQYTNDSCYVCHLMPSSVDKHSMATAPLDLSATLQAMPHGKGLRAGLCDATPAARIPASHLQHQQCVCVFSRTTVTCRIMPHQLHADVTGTSYDQPLGKDVKIMIDHEPIKSWADFMDETEGSTTLIFPTS
ncbi:hypothetical protein SRHO_G00124290 [Serrasalmus rhombeus]